MTVRRPEFFLPLRKKLAVFNPKDFEDDAKYFYACRFHGYETLTPFEQREIIKEDKKKNDDWFPALLGAKLRRRRRMKYMRRRSNDIDTVEETKSLLEEDLNIRPFAEEEYCWDWEAFFSITFALVCSIAAFWAVLYGDIPRRFTEMRQMFYYTEEEAEFIRKSGFFMAFSAWCSEHQLMYSESFLHSWVESGQQGEIAKLTYGCSHPELYAENMRTAQVSEDDEAWSRVNFHHTESKHDFDDPRDFRDFWKKLHHYAMPWHMESWFASPSGPTLNATLMIMEHHSFILSPFDIQEYTMTDGKAIGAMSVKKNFRRFRHCKKCMKLTDKEAEPYAVEPPIVRTVSDWIKIIPLWKKWTRLVNYRKDRYPWWEAQWIAYRAACVEMAMKHETQRLVVSRPENGQMEKWEFVDALYAEVGKDWSYHELDLLIPLVVTFAGWYEADGDHDFLKDSVPLNILHCDVPMLRDVSGSLEWEVEREKAARMRDYDPILYRRHVWMIRLLHQELNAAWGKYKHKFCAGKFNKKREIKPHRKWHHYQGDRYPLRDKKKNKEVSTDDVEKPVADGETEEVVPKKPLVPAFLEEKGI